MRVEFLGPVPGDNERVMLAGGGARGAVVWRGSPLVAGSVVDVEFSVSSEVDWRDIYLNPLPDELLPAVPPGRMALVGTVEDVDESRVLTLVLRGGGVVLIDTVGE